MTSFYEQFHCHPLDFSVNTNPLGMSPLAKRAIVEAVDGADAYPDPYCRALRAALAAEENIDKSAIVCGNGAADLIYRLVLAQQPARALVMAPSFAEYEDALESVGCEVVRFTLSECDNFALTDEVLDVLDSSIDMLFLCEPNNPTGVVSSPQLLFSIAERCEQTNTMLVVDECFNGFLPNPQRQSMKHLVASFSTLVVLRAFTKLYGMAGVRLGYLFSSNEQLRARLARVGQHWPVSFLAQVAGQAALRDAPYIEQARAMVQHQRTVVSRRLEALGLHVFPSVANYMLVRSERQDLWQCLAQRGILVRNCATYEGLSAHYIRIAVRTPEENEQLLQALTLLLQGGPTDEMSAHALASHAQRQSCKTQGASLGAQAVLTSKLPAADLVFGKGEE